ncbi:hypothetical protein SLEP1_g4670 [Rubroshorea leprosula]|uniref:Uncharacterized protein n=1 Tax=Rubroshorea leprosula TaxID=152421 RepID=A0AAV5HPG5_9ROSI|nr:hypothetical protein SLEP1_g4670 [Rubroshorea leprosula]
MDQIGKFKVPHGETSFLVLQKCTSTIVDVVISKFCSGSNIKKRRARLVRMTLEISACFVCCLVACHFEIHRLDLVKEYSHSNHLPMSILLLAPQFSLLGLAEGLLKDGMDNVYKDYLPVSMHHFGMTLGNSLVALGKFIGLVFIHVFRFWIGDNVNSSHLQYYYLMLALLTTGAIILFLILANIYHWEIHSRKEDHDSISEIDIINVTISITSVRIGSSEEESLAGVDDI